MKNILMIFLFLFVIVGAMGVLGYIYVYFDDKKFDKRRKEDEKGELLTDEEEKKCGKNFKAKRTMMRYFLNKFGADLKVSSSE